MSRFTSGSFCVRSLLARAASTKPLIPNSCSLKMRGNVGLYLCAIRGPDDGADGLLHIWRNLFLGVDEPHSFGHQLALQLQDVVCFDGEVLADDLSRSVCKFAKFFSSVIRSLLARFSLLPPRTECTNFFAK